ncbi:MAG: glycerate kinase type-2 family protein [Terriglobales bacterium]
MSSDPQDGDKLFHEMREVAETIFRGALKESSIAEAFDHHLDFGRGVLRIGEDVYNVDSYRRMLVVSMGKAGHSMAQALASKMGSRAEGIVVGSTHQPAQVPGFRYFSGGHPLPNDESLRAAAAITRSLQTLTEDSLVLYMISGGASSMVEQPIDPEITLEDLIATHRALVLSGAPITEINAIRKHLSAVKGGRLALMAVAAQQASILVSDVPESALDALASGPTMPDSSTVDQCYRVARQYGMLERFPPSVRELFEKRALEETPKPGDPLFHRSRWRSVLSNATAQKAAAVAAADSGFAVDIDNSCDDWDYARAADHLLERLRERRREAPRLCLISGGEVTVEVEDGDGMGGRNQHFALYCAQKIAGENITVLSAGTDGVDGNSLAAGAVVDGSTLERASTLGLDPAKALGRFDSHPFFRAIGDAVVTGPTGNNLRDLRILLSW